MAHSIRSLIALAILIGALVMTMSASSAGAEEKSRLQVVLERGRLIVAILGAEPPYGYRDEKGELVGFDIDLSRLVARALFNDPSKVEFVVVDGSGRWPAVNSGRVDFGTNTSVYPDRGVRVAFTRAYLDSAIGIMVRKDAGIKSLTDLNNDKFTVANFSNPQMEERAKKFFPKAKLLAFEGTAAQFLAVRTGRAHAMQQETGMLNYLAATNKGQFEVLSETVSDLSHVAFYLKQGDFDWWRFLDTAIEEMRTGSWHPQYAEIYQKWFGRMPPRR
jgi:polar amino acid transport system substrate-binding protein